jgi:Ca-activated chloride channel family protein
MSLLSTEWLFLLVLVPLYWLIAHFVSRWAKRDALALLSPQRLSAQWPGFGVAQAVNTFLLVMAVFFLILAILRPTFGYRVETYETAASEIMLVLDTSSSMLAGDVQPSRIERARRKVRDFIDRATGDRIGLVAFAGTAFVLTPLTEDGRALRLFLDEVDTELIPVPGTRMDIAIDTALEALGKSRGPSRDSGAVQVTTDSQAIVLISDGESRASPEALAAAERALSQGVRVSVLGIGTREGAPVADQSGGFKRDAAGQMVVSRLEEDQLAQIAAKGGGVYVSSVSSDADLKALYDRGLKESLGTGGERSQRRRLPIDVFQLPLFLSFLFLVLDTWLRWCRSRTNGASARESISVKTGQQRAASARSSVNSLFVTVALAAGLFRPEASLASDFLNQGDRRARSFYNQEQFGEAAREWKERIGSSEHPEARDLYNLGSALYRSGQYEEAAAAWTAASQAYAAEAGQAGGADQKAELQNRAADALHNLGNAELLRGKAENAIKAFEGALQLRPNDSGSSENLARARALLQQQQQQSGDQKEQAGDPQPQSGDQQEQAGDPQPQSGDQQEQAGDPQPQSGDQKEQAGDPQPESGDQQEQAGDPQPESGDQQEQAGDPQPESGDQKEQAGDRQPESGDQQEQAGDPEKLADSASGDLPNAGEQKELSAAELQKIMGQVDENPRKYLQYKARQRAQKQMEKYGAPKEGGQDW